MQTLEIFIQRTWMHPNWSPPGFKKMLSSHPGFTYVYLCTHKKLVSIGHTVQKQCILTEYYN